MVVTQARKRLEALETAAGGSGFPPCPACGESDGEPEEGVVFSVVFVDPDAPEDEPCPECGRTPINIYFPEHMPHGR